MAYYTMPRISSDPQERIRRVGVVQGWRNGKVVVLHACPYAELVRASDLQLLDSH